LLIFFPIGTLEPSDDTLCLPSNFQTDNSVIFNNHRASVFEKEKQLTAINAVDITQNSKYIVLNRLSGPFWGDEKFIKDLSQK